MVVVTGQDAFTLGHCRTSADRVPDDVPLTRAAESYEQHTACAFLTWGLGVLSILCQTIQRPVTANIGPSKEVGTRDDVDTAQSLTKNKNSGRQGIKTFPE